MPAALTFAAVMLASSSGIAAQSLTAGDPRPANTQPIAAHRTGRIQPAADGMYTYQWPGVYFDVSFTGSDLYFRTDGKRQDLVVFADSKRLPSFSAASSSDFHLSLPGGASRKHSVRINVVNENQDGPKSLGAFAVPASSSAGSFPAETKLAMEFIGDSHTVGYGNKSSTRGCSQDDVWARTDTSRSLGVRVAEHYRADYEINAISGRGVVRNYNGTPAPTLPEAYPFTLFDQRQRSHDDTWKPTVLAVSMGTNDFSTPLNGGERWNTREELHTEFERTYTRFVRELRKQHPQAYILLWSTDLASGEIAAEGQKVADLLRASGDANIDFVEVTGLAFSGCHWHPSVADDAVIADKLIAAIDRHAATLSHGAQDPQRSQIAPF